MGLTAVLKRNRAKIAREMGYGRYRNFSAAHAARCRNTVDMIRRFAQGRVLDVGCGHMPFKSDILAVVAHYEGLDVNPVVPDNVQRGDVQSMDSVGAAQFDTVCCFEVLEHVPEPARAVAEMARVLKQGGVLLLTVPHLSRLHEEPHDYFRYTNHGLRHLMEQAGLETVEVVPYASLASFVAHQLSTLIVTLAWPVPILRQVVYAVNCVVLVWPVRFLDRMLDRRGLAPLGYHVVARKPRALHQHPDAVGDSPEAEDRRD